MTGGEARQDTQAGSAAPPAPADEHPPHSAMATVLSLGEELTMLSALSDSMYATKEGTDA
ncbi:hypothetical protein OIE82_02875 [Streptomyces althioticus]|uniref:Uncharacterized protein n=1 Tax=Streptomyces althioticus TaxID=83380 RepID=A0ABZ1Y1C1_9ACTN|nr:hypothetical protein OG968_02485 [Streptomyces althioticus]WTB96241.1 hypothetical protein OHA53_32440 [Streptomyces althioticus]GGQ47428.1 hypothetical protein GCM10010267_06840 [Streptomyces griseorubens]